MSGVEARESREPERGSEYGETVAEGFKRLGRRGKRMVMARYKGARGRCDQGMTKSASGACVQGACASASRGGGHCMWGKQK